MIIITKNKIKFIKSFFLKQTVSNSIQELRVKFLIQEAGELAR